MYKKFIVTLSLTHLLFGSTLIDGNKAFNQKHYSQAFSHFVKVAQDGMIAKYNLGVMYENGLGVKRDINKAISFYKLSANDGYKKAQKKLKLIQKIIQKKQKAITAYLTIRSNVTKDKVYIDGKYVGHTKITVPVLANKIHKVEVKKDGWKTYKFKDITLKPQQKKTVRAVLHKKYK